MGINFSTKNYEKIVSVIEQPYLEPIKKINEDVMEMLNFDNDTRYIIYKHRKQPIYLLYVGGICAVSECFEVNENKLLRYTDRFDCFSLLKKHIIENFPNSELLVNLVQYESLNFGDIIDQLEKGLNDFNNSIIIDFNESDFTDSESSGCNSNEEFLQEDPINKHNDLSSVFNENSLDWVNNWNYTDDYDFSFFSPCYPDNNCNPCEIANHASKFASNLVKETLDFVIQSHKTLEEVSDTALNTARAATKHASDLSDETEKIIQKEKKHNENRLKIIKEEKIETDDEDTIEEDLPKPDIWEDESLWYADSLWYEDIGNNDIWNNNYFDDGEQPIVPNNDYLRKID
jgi:hypothetical protein